MLTRPVARPAPSSAASGTPDRFPGDPLDQLVEHLRRHPRVDGGSFLVLDTESRRLRPLASWHASPALAAAVAPLLDRPYVRGTPGFVEAALERGRPLFLPRVESWEAADRLQRGLHGRLAPQRADELWTALLGASVIACPVRDGTGQVVGALEVASFDPARPLTRDDLHTIEVMADLAGTARERSVRVRLDAERGRMELALKRAAADVAGSLDTDEVLRHVVDHAVRTVDGDRAAVSWLTPDGRLERATGTGSDGIDPAWVEAVVRDRCASLQAAPHACALIPVEAGARLFGVLSVQREGPDFCPWEVEALGRLARSSAVALLNAGHFEHERRLSRALTRGFVPDALPHVDTFEVAALYEPAGGRGVGGDVYGLWHRPDGALMMLIGDAAGKGAGTAATSAMTRFFVEARSWDGAGPAEVLTGVSRMLDHRLPGDTFVTAFLACLREDRMTYANAGHLPPLLARPGRPAGALAPPGLPLGVASDPTYEQHELTLASGDLLYAFTDGLTEARVAGEMFGEDRLRATLDRHRDERVQDAVAAVHEVVRSWSGALTDDSTSLAVRRR